MKPDGIASLPWWLRVVRSVRSPVFLVVYFLYLLIYVGLAQRLVVIPMCVLFPARRTRIMGRWIRHQGFASCALARYVGGVRLTISGRNTSERCIVVMNHQSILDIAIALWVTPAPAIIPVRERYRRGMPGISPFLRAARYPFMRQVKDSARTDLKLMADAADRVARGEVSLIIFPEGHRSKTGDIEPFMPGGLQLLLRRAKVPVYCMVGDGMWRVRTFADTMTKIAGQVATVRIIGPFAPPEDEKEIPRFIESLRERMIATLRELRAAPPLHSADAVAQARPV